MNLNIGIGATDELSLRVSVATLTRVVFKHPSNGEWMLALERRGYPTVRIFRAFEAIISDSSLAHAMTMNSARNSDQVHRELAWRDYQNGGKGHANAVLALPLKQLMACYSTIPIEERSAPILFEQHQLDETVSAILEGITVPKYQRR